MSQKEPKIKVKLPKKSSFQTLYKKASKPSNMCLSYYRSKEPDFVEMLQSGDPSDPAMRLYKQGKGSDSGYFYAWFNARDRRRVFNGGVFDGPLTLYRVTNATTLPDGNVDYGRPYVTTVSDVFSYDFSVTRLVLKVQA